MHEKIIKSPDTRDITERAVDKDGVKGFRNRKCFQFQCKQERMQYAGRESWSESKNRATLFLHNGICLGKIEIPKLYNITLGVFRKHK